MKKIRKGLMLLILAAIVTGCSSTAKFKVPKNTTLFIENQEVTNPDMYKRNPFFWNVTKGIPYRLEKKGKVIDQGTIKGKFRVVSIFWPPGAIIYWPMGFDKTGYDFTEENMLVRPESKYSSVRHRKKK